MSIVCYGRIVGGQYMETYRAVQELIEQEIVDFLVVRVVDKIHLVIEQRQIDPQVILRRSRRFQVWVRNLPEIYSDTLLLIIVPPDIIAAVDTFQCPARHHIYSPAGTYGAKIQPRRPFLDPLFVVGIPTETNSWVSRV